MRYNARKLGNLRTSPLGLWLLEQSEIKTTITGILVVCRKSLTLRSVFWLEFSDSSHVVLNAEKWREVLSDVIDPERCVVGYVRSTDVAPDFSGRERRGTPADRRG